MNPRKSQIALVLVGAWGLMLSGCENLHASARRQPAPVVSGAEYRGEGESRVESPAEAKGFFKATRRPGAFSSEGAEVEKHLLGG